MCVNVISFSLPNADDERPVVSCPGDIVGKTTNAISYTPKASLDNVPDPVVAYRPSTLSPGSQFPLGISSVAISVTDTAGNTANCSFDVNVTRKFVYWDTLNLL